MSIACLEAIQWKNPLAYQPVVVIIHCYSQDCQVREDYLQTKNGTFHGYFGKPLPRALTLGIWTITTLFLNAPLWWKEAHDWFAFLKYTAQAGVSKPSRKQLNSLPGNHLFENFRWKGCERLLVQPLSSLPIPMHIMGKKRRSWEIKWLSLISEIGTAGPGIGALAFESWGLPPTWAASDI